jgi:hypothetical protein
MVVAGVAADTVRLQGEFLAEGIGYFAYFAYAFPIWPRAPQGCEEGLVKGIPAGHYTASKDNKAEMFRTGGLVTLLWPKGAWVRDRENGDFRKGPVGC